MSEDDIILAELSDEELVQQMHDDLYDGLKDEVEEATRILLDRGWVPYDVLTQALVEGMRIVGIDFRDGILFVPEVLLSANAMKAGMNILRPLLAATGAPKQGKMVIGTVKGDIHDIGKNLVGMMMEGAGFDVIDLGINNPVENYLEALEREKPDILGMSALLTTTMPYMKVVIDTMKEKGIRSTRSSARRSEPMPIAAMRRSPSRRPRNTSAASTIRCQPVRKSRLEAGFFSLSLARSGAVYVAAGSLRRIYSVGCVCADAADGVAAGAESSSRDKESGDNRDCLGRHEKVLRWVPIKKRQKITFRHRNAPIAKKFT